MIRHYVCSQDSFTATAKMGRGQALASSDIATDLRHSPEPAIGRTILRRPISGAWIGAGAGIA